MTQAPSTLKLEKLSIGVGDRFAHQAKAQLEACRLAAGSGVTVIPVWNKSNREHLLVGSTPLSVRAAADEAVRAVGWQFPYHVDADHISFATVDRYIDSSDFFTLDVAEAIGHRSDGVDAFVWGHRELIGGLCIPGIEEPLSCTADLLFQAAAKYLFAVGEAGRLYRRIEDRRDGRPFVTEISIDETDAPQTPQELLVILAAIAEEGIPIQTIAPKFSGRFNKGVDYAGNVDEFEREFEADLAIIDYAVTRYDLPGTLKLSVHSGSDKFSLYAPIRRALEKRGRGIHLKTAGTTWLEELIGLAEGGGNGLALAKEVYAKAYAHRAELCRPYATVIDIREERLPSPADVASWTAGQFTSALRHDQGNPEFNPDLRQLLHVGYKIAADMGQHYLEMLREFEGPISQNVTHNLFERHIRPLFL